MKYLLTSLYLFFIVTVVAQIKSPNEFLPHKIGEHFTPHHLLVDYFQHVAKESAMVQLETYGETNLERPLIAAFISSEENLASLDDIRRYNLKVAGIEENDIQLDRDIAIVWLSCSVHGNEASGSESSYEILYELVNPENTETKKWLENTIVILDPSINPDGYSRYTHWVRNYAGNRPNADPFDIEHQEPWPGGRTNHYYFDLNRDWAWQTQVESQQRMKLYNSWLPHVHADLHEMGYTNPYYFAPAAQPFHEYITQWQREFQYDIGRNHAKYFDEYGWLFFTREVYDLFYPSYGDTYPTFSGAIGMTYEQGGGGSGGRSIKLPNDEFLTLSDRINHHRTSALSTIEVSSKNAKDLVSNFRQFYYESRENPPGKYRSYVIKSDATGQKLKALADLLSKQDIQYGTVENSSELRGFNYNKGEVTLFDVQPGDLVVNSRQPKGVLTQILLEPESHLVDSLTYDITAWSLPYAYGLQAYALEEEEFDLVDKEFESRSKDFNSAAVAYALEWGSLEHAKALSLILQEGISARVLLKEMKNSGKHFTAGTVLITKADNKSSFPDLAASLEALLEGLDVKVEILSTGFSEEGPDLGSGSVSLIKQPNILVVTGEDVSSYDFGQVRYFFEQRLDMGITAISMSRLRTIDLDRYSTLVLPAGRYRISDSRIGEIQSWMRNGGKVIAMRSSLNIFADRDGFALSKYATSEEQSKAEREEDEQVLAERLETYQGQDRRSIKKQIPGAIIKLEMDKTNPLSFGIDQDYFSLKTGSDYYSLIKNAWNAAYIPKDPQIAGFVGSEIKEKIQETVVYGVEEQGRGSIVYMVDNPLFRGFWNIGQLLFANAVFFAGS